MLGYHVHTMRTAGCNAPLEARCDASIRCGVTHTHTASTEDNDLNSASSSIEYYIYTDFMSSVDRIFDGFKDDPAIVAAGELDSRTRIVIYNELPHWTDDRHDLVGAMHYGGTRFLVHRCMAGVGRSMLPPWTIAHGFTRRSRGVPWRELPIPTRRADMFAPRLANMVHFDIDHDRSNRDRYISRILTEKRRLNPTQRASDRRIVPVCIDCLVVDKLGQEPEYNLEGTACHGKDFCRFSSDA